MRMPNVCGAKVQTFKGQLVQKYRMKHFFGTTKRWLNIFFPTFFLFTHRTFFVFSSCNCPIFRRNRSWLSSLHSPLSSKQKLASVQTKARWARTWHPPKYTGSLSNTETDFQTTCHACRTKKRFVFSLLAKLDESEVATSSLSFRLDRPPVHGKLRQKRYATPNRDWRHNSGSLCWANLNFGTMPTKKPRNNRKMARVLWRPFWTFFTVLVQSRSSLKASEKMTQNQRRHILIFHTATSQIRGRQVPSEKNFRSVRLF